MRDPLGATSQGRYATRHFCICFCLPFKACMHVSCPCPHPPSQGWRHWQPSWRRPGRVISRHAPVEVPRNLMVCSITCRGIQLLGRVEARGFPGADGSEIVDRSSPSPSLSPSSLMPPVPATCPLPHACNDCPFPIPTPSLHAQPSCTKRTRWLATLAGSPQNAGLRRLPGRLLYGHLVPFHHAHSPGSTPFSAPFGGMNCVARRRERYDL
jgi:hypothetical protein